LRSLLGREMNIVHSNSKKEQTEWRFDQVPNYRGILRGGAFFFIPLLLALFVAVECIAGWEPNAVDTGLPEPVTALAVGDADNDGENEVIAGGDGYGLRIYRGLRSRWDFEVIVDELSVDCAAIGDLDNDGENEVVCATSDRKVLLYEWSGTGWSVKTIERKAESPATSISCGDADSDGRNELAVGMVNGRIVLYECVGGTWISATVFSKAGVSVDAVAVGDPDLDGRSEVIAGTSDRRVLIFERVEGEWVGTTVDSRATPGVASIEIGDCDCDEKPEIVVGTTGKKIYGYEWNGESWSREVIDNNAGGRVPGLEVSDLEGDGFNELIAISSSKSKAGSSLMIYEKAAAEWHREEVKLQAVGEASALCVGDPDNDGKLELLVGVPSAKSIYVCDEFSVRRVVRRHDTGDIVLIWESEAGESFYVYYSETPYEGYTYAATTTATAESVQWVDDGSEIRIHPEEVKTRYYIVRKTDPDVVSNTVGKFTRTFSVEMHLTSLPLVPYSSWIQDVIGTQLTGAKGEGYADRVWKWEQNRGEFQFAWLVDGIGPEYNGRWWCTRPFGPSAMTLNFGDGFFIQSQNGRQDVTFVGALPAGVVRMRSIRPGLQMVGAPHAEPVLLDSTDLFESGATGAPYELAADRVWRWDEETLRYKRAWLVDLTGTEDDGTWWDSETWGKAATPMTPGTGYWYQARGNAFFWTFLDEVR